MAEAAPLCPFSTTSGLLSCLATGCHDERGRYLDLTDLDFTCLSTGSCTTPLPWAEVTSAATGHFECLRVKSGGRAWLAASWSLRSWD
eukprot:765919-Hanusia_phi.AAC.1